MDSPTGQDSEPAAIAADLALVERIAAVPLILRIMCDTTGLGFAAVARVTETSWTACAVLDRIGFGVKPGGQLDVLSTLCRETRVTKAPVVIEKASEDARYSSHPTPQLYGFESYVGLPIMRRDGSVFGTMCALDPMPASLSETEVLPTLELFAELIGAQIELQERVDRSQSALFDAAQIGALREQFIAVLGHDLRNPLAALIGGLDLLSHGNLDKSDAAAVGRMQQSCWRMNELVNNLLDLARGRLGGGLPVERRNVTDLATTLSQIIDELKSAQPGHAIRSELDLRAPVFCDPQRIGQLLSNLLANALAYGAPDQPVAVRASSGADGFALSVTNRGEPIPPGTLARLFQPYSRADTDTRRAGLGLGLYIASEIARAHGGALTVDSTADATTFKLTIPTAGPPQ